MEVGHPDLRTDPTGLAHDYGYDPAGRRTSEVVTRGGAEVARFTSAYDPASNVVPLSAGGVTHGNRCIEAW